MINGIKPSDYDAVLTTFADKLQLLVQVYLDSFNNNSSELITDTKEAIKLATKSGINVLYDNYRGRLEEVTVHFSDNSDDIIFRFSGQSADSTTPITQSGCKALFNGDDSFNCRKELEALRKAINHYTIYNDNVANAELELTLKEAQGIWTKYYKNARATTIIDDIFSYYVNNKHYRSATIAKPAEIQYFLFHPIAAIEHIPDTSKGEKTEFSYGLEIIGANKWNAKVPYGASLSTLYTDRKGVSSFGVGASLHIYNHYTLGYIYRNNGSGVYLDINLTELFTDKRGDYVQFKKEVKSIVNMK